MKQKRIGWIALPVCLVAATIAVIGGRQTMPPSARAAAPPQANVVPAETTQACQAVVEQMVTIQRVLVDEERSRTIKRLAALDELVAQEYLIDTSKCPTDFRMAVLRFVAAEDAMCIRAHMDKTGKAEEILGAAVEIFATKGLSAGKSLQSIIGYYESVAGDQKQDLANIQSAMLDLVQAAMNYGVK